jgi:hypothetical protein
VSLPTTNWLVRREPYNLRRTPQKVEAGQTASLTGLSIILFFTLLALGDALAALPGLALCLVHFLVSRAAR